MILVSGFKDVLLVCSACHAVSAPHGACRRCGTPADVDGYYTRRRRVPPASWMLTLAHNIAIGAGLCRAFVLGEERSEPWPDVDGEWTPGCGRAAR